MKAYKFSYLQLIRRKLTSSIAILAIGISVGFCGVLLRIFLLSESRFFTLVEDYDSIIAAKNSTSDILLQSSNLEGDTYPEYLPFALFQTLRAQSSVSFEDQTTSTTNFVQRIAPFLFCGQIEKFKVIGTDEDFFSPRGFAEIQDGRLWQNNEVGILLGSELASEKKLHVGDSFEFQEWTLSLDRRHQQGPTLSLPVLAILKSTKKAYDYAAFVPLKYAQNLIQKTLQPEDSIWGSQVLNYFLLQTKPGLQSSARHMIHRRTVAQMIIKDQEIYKLQQISGLNQRLGLIITMIILLLGTFSVAGVMIAKSESTEQQIAILRALGYSKKYISQSLAYEALIIGGCSVFVGMILDAVFFPIVQKSLEHHLPHQALTASSLFHSYPVWMAAMIAAQFSLLIPIYKIYRMDVHFALRKI